MDVDAIHVGKGVFRRGLVVELPSTGKNSDIVDDIGSIGNLIGFALTLKER